MRPPPDFGVPIYPLEKVIFQEEKSAHRPSISYKKRAKTDPATPRANPVPAT